MSSRTGRYRIKPTNTRSPRKVIAIAVGALVVVIAIAATVLHALEPKSYTLKQGTILTIDVTNRTGKVEFIHPKTGKTTQVDAEVPKDCILLIDGQPADIRDVRLGDKISSAFVTYYAGSGRAVARDVRITRTPASQPAATTPAVPSTAPAVPAESPTTPAPGT